MKLNVGCGAEVIKRYDWINMDLYKPEYTKWEIVSQDIHTLPYPDNSIDEIVASHSLEHLERPSDAIREWNRVLKPGGFLLIAVPDNNKRLEWIGIHYMTLELRGENHKLEEHHIDFTWDTLKKMIEESGNWGSVKIVNPSDYWELIGKTSWQLVVRADKGGK